jgi:hypothetical protein
VVAAVGAIVVSALLVFGVVRLGWLDGLRPAATPTQNLPTGEPAGQEPESPTEDEVEPEPTEPIESMTQEPEPWSPEPTEVDPQSSLQEQRDGDFAQVSLDGHWAAQLSSKYEGVVDPSQVASNGSHTFYVDDIWAEHIDIRADDRYAGVPILLLDADDFGKRRVRSQTIWVTLADVGLESEAAVISWCREINPGLSAAEVTNVCMPRRMLAPHD